MLPPTHIELPPERAHVGAPRCKPGLGYDGRMASRRVVRGMPRAWALLLTFIMGAFVCGMPLAIAADDGWTLVPLAIAAVLAVPWLWLLVRAARMRFVGDDEGVTVANYWSSQRLPWSEITELTTALGSTAWQTGSGRLEITVLTRRGHKVLASATSTPARELRWLVEQMAPIVRIADRHGVPTVWRELSEMQQEAIRQQLVALGDIATRVGRLA